MPYEGHIKGSKGEDRRWVELHPPGPWHGPEAPHEAREANGVSGDRALSAGWKRERERGEGKAPRRDKPSAADLLKRECRRKERAQEESTWGAPPRTPAAAESMVPPMKKGGARDEHGLVEIESHLGG